MTDSSLGPSLVAAHFTFYTDTPSLGAAIVFGLLFALTTAVHAYQLVRNKAWFFAPVAVGGCFELIGFIARMISYSDPQALGPSIVQSLFLLLAPTCFAAAIYTLLERVVNATGKASLSPMPPKDFIATFLSGDILSFLLQLEGGALMAKGADTVQLGQTLIRGGLGVQLLFFGVFWAVSFTFHNRMLGQSKGQSNSGAHKQPSREVVESSSVEPDDDDSSQSSTTSPVLPSNVLPWERMLYTMYTTSGLIFIRSIFRIIEFYEGSDGYIVRHEVFLYLFDAFLMWLLMVVFNVMHPHKIPVAPNPEDRSEPQKVAAAVDTIDPPVVVEGT